MYSDTQKSRDYFGFGVDTYNRIEFAAVIGYEHKLNEKSKLTLSYTQGITGVLNQDYFINYRNSQLMLGLTYALKTRG